MWWLVFGFGALLLFALAFVVWREWIAPWTIFENLTNEIFAAEKPRTFLLSGNRSARRAGLVLEKIADRQRALLERSHHAESGLQALLEAIPDGLAVVDEKRRIQLTNRAFVGLFRIEKFSPGLTLLEVLHDAGVDRALGETLRSGEAQRDSIRLQRSDEDRTIEVTIEPLPQKSAGQRGAVVLFRDVTRLHRVEQVRRDFVANVSHELRTPLSIFRGYLEALLENPRQSPAELLRIFEVMEKHSDRLNLLVEDVLSLAQLEEPSARLIYTEIYLPDFLAAILRDWEKRFETKLLKSSLDAPEDLPVLTADENRLQEVIYNLLDNAVKYSQPEGSVSLKAERVGDQLRIAISDEGVGIPARDLPRVFERFYRADKARSREVGGTGLGLSIVKHIAELHGGNVEAESELGHGTTISVVLPIRPENALALSQDRNMK